MVNLNEVIEGNANNLSPENYQRILDAVSDVIHDLPRIALRNPELDEALRKMDLERCRAIERETFPALLTGIREITSRDPCLLMACLQMFGLSNIDKTLQAVAFGQMLAFECILAYIRKHSQDNEVAELTRMFNRATRANKPVDAPNNSCNNIDMEDNAA